MATTYSQGQNVYNPAGVLEGTAQYDFVTGAALLPGQTTTDVGLPVIDSGVLNGNGTALNVPQTTPGVTPTGFLAGITPGAPVISPITVPTTSTALQNQFATAYNQLAGKSAEQLRLEEEAGIGDQQTAIDALSAEITNSTARYNAEANNISGTAGTQESLIGRTSRLRREEAIDIGVKNAQLLGMQGNLESAKAEVEKTLNLEFDPIYTQIEALKTFASINPDLTRSEQDSIAKTVASQQSYADSLYDAKQDAYNLALDNVAPQGVMSAITSANTIAEIKAAVAQYDDAESIGVDYNFTDTQSNKGSANAGLSISEFNRLPGDVQNFYVNSPSADIQGFNALLSDVVSETINAEEAIQNVNSSPYSTSVKNYLVGQINDNAPEQSEESGGFFNAVGSFFSNIFN